MNYNEIKSRIISYDPLKWWGDDVDARFYLILKIENIMNKKILDIGGGIGIVSAELDKNNFRVNLDTSFNDLKKCKRIDSEIHCVCSTMDNLPFVENSFDLVLSSSSLQYIKNNDLKSNKIEEKNGIKKYPSIQKTLSEVYRTMKNNSKLIIVTPNNAYYNSYMLTYNELKMAIKEFFPDYTLKFYNTFPKLSKKFRKLNLANSIPKIMLKIKNPVKVISSLIQDDNGITKKSVSFYLEAIKSQ